MYPVVVQDVKEFLKQEAEKEIATGKMAVMTLFGKELEKKVSTTVRCLSDLWDGEEHRKPRPPLPHPKQPRPRLSPRPR